MSEKGFLARLSTAVFLIWQNSNIVSTSTLQQKNANPRVGVLNMKLLKADSAHPRQYSYLINGFLQRPPL